MCQQDAGLWSLGSWGVSEIPPGALKNLSLSPQLPSLPSGEGHRVPSLWKHITKTYKPKARSHGEGCCCYEGALASHLEGLQETARGWQLWKS